MKKIIVAIGGGEIGRSGYPLETLQIDKEIVKLSKKKRPKLLFLPTASRFSEAYTDLITKLYGRRLGCSVNALYLIRDKPNASEIRKKILGADIIYVGGGNTLRMMRVWRRMGVDHLLKKAYKKGIILCGLSAGSICWFESGHSDSMCFYSPKKWNYIRVKGLGIIPAIHCPHYDSATLGKKRKKDFHKFMKKHGGIGIGVDNCCAIVFSDDSFRVISSKKGANAYEVECVRGKIVETRIPKINRPTPISAIL